MLVGRFCASWQTICVTIGYFLLKLSNVLVNSGEIVATMALIEKVFRNLREKQF